MSDDRMKEIITALLETEGRTEAEVKATQAKAAKLMAKLGITRESIMASRPDLAAGSHEITRFDWIVCQSIMVAISDLTGTQCWYDVLLTASGKRSDRKRITYAGYRSDVDQATWLLRHLLDAAKQGSSGLSVNSERTSYLVGFASAVYQRIRELEASLNSARPELDRSTGSDLVIARDTTVEEFVKTLVSGLVTGGDKGSKVKNGAAFAGGQAAGKSVSLGKGVGAGPKALPSS